MCHSQIIQERGPTGSQKNKYDLNIFIRITKGQIWFLTLTTQIV